MTKLLRVLYTEELLGVSLMHKQKAIVRLMLMPVKAVVVLVLGIMWIIGLAAGLFES